MSNKTKVQELSCKRSTCKSHYYDYLDEIATSGNAQDWNVRNLTVKRN